MIDGPPESSAGRRHVLRLEWASIGWLVSRCLLAVVFAASAVGKLLGPEEFYSFASAIPFLSQLPAAPIFAVLIALEGITALLLLRTKTAFAGSVLSFALLFLFLLVLMSASQSEVTGRCGCFGGVYVEESLDVSIHNDLVFLLLSVGCIAGGTRPKNTKGRD